MLHLERGVGISRWTRAVARVVAGRAQHARHAYRTSGAGGTGIAHVSRRAFSARRAIAGSRLARHTLRAHGTHRPHRSLGTLDACVAVLSLGTCALLPSGLHGMRCDRGVPMGPSGPSTPSLPASPCSPGAPALPSLPSVPFLPGVPGGPVAPVRPVGPTRSGRCLE